MTIASAMGTPLAASESSWRRLRLLPLARLAMSNETLMAV